ncbi:MAG: hypothetical protein JWR19_1473 [Pedosphaera sp.]|nr:hypothetical protein [Pedosphaera sp.]
MKKHPQFRPVPVLAFTLIELLVVIAIIGVLAALLVPLTAIVSKKKAFARAEGELQEIQAVISRYKAKKGFYPPDNTNAAAPNQLFYELMGTPFNSGVGVYSNQFGGDVISINTIDTIFHAGGIVNSSVDSTEVDKFFPNMKSANIENIGNIAAPIWIFSIPSRGPNPIMVGGKEVNPVYYISSNPTNNSADGSYDLWVDILIGGKTNRISNWSKDPQIVP